MTAAFAVGVPSGILVAAGILAAPVAITVGSVAAIWGFFSGWSSSSKSEANSSKGKLLDHLESITHTVRSTYLRGVEDVFKQSERSLIRQVDAAAHQKRQQLATELERIENEERMTQEQRVEELRTVDNAVSQWKRIGIEVSDIQKRLGQLHAQLAVKR